jgi:hypothetical protein
MDIRMDKAFGWPLRDATAAGGKMPGLPGIV